MKTINHSYCIRTRTERAIAHLTDWRHPDNPILWSLAWAFALAVLFVLLAMPEQARASEKSSGDVAWGECKGTGIKPGTIVCTMYTAGMHRGIALAEAAQKDAGLEREKESLEFLIQMQETAVNDLQADAMLLKQLRMHLDSSLSSLPATSPNNAGRVELMSTIEVIESRINEIESEQQQLKTRLENLKRLLADLK